jgi:hypothetical protein
MAISAFDIIYEGKEERRIVHNIGDVFDFDRPVQGRCFWAEENKMQSESFGNEGKLE